MSANIQKENEGQLFTRLYLEKSAPVQDNILFRNRINAYFRANHYKDDAKVSSYLQQEAGIIIKSTWLEASKSVYYDYQEFFTTTRIEFVLNSITLIRDFLVKNYFDIVKYETVGNKTKPIFETEKADAWQQFVFRALREENMAYTLDNKCGVHYYVDEEFERNRNSALKCLSAPRYSAVRAAFDSAYRYLDIQQCDTKAAVRSAFESLEILARLIDPESKNLNRWMVENKLKPIACLELQDSIEIKTVNSLFDGIALLVDGLHNYRHGQPVENPVAPSMTVSIYVISTVASALRWLATIDANQQAK